jgi:Short C-terminal domain
MGMRRRARRRGLVAGAVAGGAVAHHRAKRQAQDEYDQAPVDENPYVPPAANPADEIEHLAQLHSSGVLTDEEFATAKAKVLGS